MIVCVCKRISDREIVRQAEAGLDFDDIQFELGVSTQCGRCECCVRDIVARCHATSDCASRAARHPLEASAWTASSSQPLRWVAA